MFLSPMKITEMQYKYGGVLRILRSCEAAWSCGRFPPSESAIFQKNFVLVSPCAQPLYLNATQIDDDQVDDAEVEYSWTCVDNAGDNGCESASGSALDVDSFASGAVMAVPADILPIGETKVCNWSHPLKGRRRNKKCGIFCDILAAITW